MSIFKKVKMKRALNWSTNLLGVPAGDTMWENIQRIYHGYHSGTIALTDPLSVQTTFILDSSGWVWLGVYAFALLLVNGTPHLFKIVKRWNAKRQEKKLERQKQLIREILKEILEDK
ncbi:hypothetical protein ABER75_11505 [Niallia taxi]|uniref:hypothetical protein n=1 Tax=Niallia taxi TaxID=2499688 RepID=UPI00203C63F4|nr:hypothetical protein [Niallia taxi]MCM3216719.1 hypothetical protein [Niallia taxi]